MASNTISEDGTILRDARSRYRNRAQDGAHGAFEVETRASGKTPRAEVTISRVQAPDDVAELGGGDVVVRARRMFSDDRLVQLCDTYIPNFVVEAAPAVAEQDTGQGGIINRMADAGLAQTKVVEDVTLRSATTAQAEAFGVDEGKDLLTITHTGLTEDGRVVEVSVHTLAPGWTLRYDVPLS
ncbi:UTRA domain-containing protein [Streptomyces sp. NPDC099050]|uniref:UTRA domain-containing protein n=1 Tax=Streptomyces sp. NPDC099050 TaxID=3366100 RepID=UPI00380A5F87